MLGGHHPKGRDHYLRNIVYHRLSSFEINIWGGLMDTFRSLPRRSLGVINQYGFIVVGTYLLQDWMKKENWRSHRKNPKDFENDE